MSRGRPGRPQKRLVFWAGEGNSERGYARWLNRLAAKKSIAISIHAEALSGGDPLDLVQQSIQKLFSLEKRRSKYPHRFLALDDDLRGNNANRDREALELARSNNLKLIWQPCCHEGLLLRHFEETKNLRPHDAKAALEQLLKVWPQYEKGADATLYERHLDEAHINCARSSYPGIDRVFQQIGWKR